MKNIPGWITWVAVVLCMGSVAMAQNEAPVASSDSYETWLNTPLIIPAAGVLTNDSDPDADPITAVLATGVSHGKLNLYADGSFDYSPFHAVTGTDTFTYVACDGSVSSAVATVTLNVRPTVHKRLVVLMVAHEDYAGGLFTTNDVLDEMDITSDAYREMSYNQMDFAGAVNSNLAADVYGWYTYTGISKFHSEFWDMDQLVDLADDEVDFTLYDYVIVIYAPQADVGWVAPAYGGQTTLTTDDGSVSVGWVKLKSSTMGANLLMHELGHTLGLADNYFMNCGDEVISKSSYTLKKYGDPYDVMGWIPGQFHACNKDTVGWLSGPNHILEITNAGTYQVTLEPLESNSGGLKAIKTPRGPFPLYVEYRQRLGMDTHYDATNDVFQGALFHWGIRLLNMHPPAEYGSLIYENDLEATLKDGETFVDPVTGHSYEVITNDSDGLVLEVILTGFEFNKPLVALTSPVPGTVLSGDVTLFATATDDSDILRVEFEYCPADYPWVSLGTATVAGAMNTYTVTVDTASTLPNGVGQLHAKAYDIYSNFMFTSDMNVSVSNTADTTPPTVAINYPINGYTHNTNTISVAVSASDDSGMWEVELFMDGNYMLRVANAVSGSGIYAIPVERLSRGPHTLVARAWDCQWNSADSDPVAFTVIDEVDEGNPWGWITHPVGGAILFGVVDVTCIAGDNVGVDAVVYQLNDTDVYTNTVPPYVFPFDSTVIADGEGCHLRAFIFDAADNVSMTFINVIVDQDVDDDGLPSVWEVEHFGGPTNATASADDDGDEVSNYAEYIAGTNPKTNASVLALAPYATNQTTTANLIFRWPSVTGRVYSIWRATNAEGVYTQHIGNLLANAPTNSLTNAAPSELGTYFYGIQVSWPDAP